MRSLLASKKRTSLSGQGNTGKLPPVGATAVFAFEGNVNAYGGSPAGAFSRTTNAWNPETGAVALNQMLQYSNAFTTSPWAAFSGTGTWNQNAVDPFGVANSAWTATDTSAANNNGYSQSLTLVSGVKYFVSVFVKKTVGTPASYPALTCYKASYSVGVVIDTTNGTATAITSYEGTTIGATTDIVVSNYSTDYWRVSFAFTANANAAWIPTLHPAANTDGSGAIVLSAQGSAVFFGAMFSQGALFDYYPSTSAAVYAPRYLTGKSGQSVLPEESSTNLLVQSNSFTTSWTAQSLATPAQGTTDPFGGATGWTLTESAINDLHRVYLAGSAVSAGATATVSAHLKAGTCRYVYLAISGTKNVYAVIDTTTWMVASTGGTGTYTASGIVPVGNGWYRAYVTGALATETVYSCNIGLSNSNAAFTGYLGTGQTLSVYGAQLEQLPYSTSYIPTGASAVTRGAETLTFNPTGILTPSQGTISAWVYVDPQKQATANPLTIFAMGSGANSIFFWKNALANYYTFTVRNNANAPKEAVVTNALSAGWHHFAATWDSSFLRLYIDAVKSETACVAGDLPSSLSATANIGWSGVAYQLDQALDQFRIYPTALTAAQIAQLYRSGK